MKKLKILLISTFITINTMYSNNEIILYLKYPPKEILDSMKKNNLNIFNNQIPSDITNELVNNKLSFDIHKILRLDGFVALYKGYIDYSNFDGLISFPLKHVNSRLYIAITPSIDIIKVKGNTISHFKKGKNVPLQVYILDKKYDKDDNAYWQIGKLFNPEELDITENTLILLTNPTNIYIPEGDFLTAETIQMILPNIYVVGNINHTNILLKSLDIKRFFEPIKIKEKIVNKQKQKMIINN